MQYKHLRKCSTFPFIICWGHITVELRCDAGARADELEKNPPPWCQSTATPYFDADDGDYDHDDNWCWLMMIKLTWCQHQFNPSSFNRCHTLKFEFNLHLPVTVSRINLGKNQQLHVETLKGSTESWKTLESWIFVISLLHVSSKRISNHQIAWTIEDYSQFRGTTCRAV